ncbi:nucleotidyl transferase AbiEii/AbiGii toxin family protein [Streptomyces rubellomurinus]|uniref:nucleotidyl transferase AbiEii/AbiGii toxin family protein n=1 Tax=Streptomyces rubellomurinus (strain ATCC 31215) TaxID=359131 RepID=UPI0007C76611|nr:nucleotidyl transferase AbiEii/AbiGii toxin family protein [Streptomyces rubellomurinus]
MTATWESFGWQASEVPRTELDNSRRAGLGVPLTLRPVREEGVVQRPIFDPALKQYSNAYRAADPRFADAAAGAAWYAARRTALDLVLTAIARSEWADCLVLRGSVLLKGWFGDDAREPGDLDFVVVPQDWRIEEERTTAMLDGIALAAQQTAGAGPVRFEAADALSEDIWTYERVPGRRLVLPWTADGTPGGVVQLDFVFNERLPLAPEPFPLCADATLNAATPELSLAWKIMWLVTDMHPQGKDLYDAVLLAESCRLRYEVLRDAFLAAEPHYALHPVRPATITDLADSVEWEHFAQEYPDIPGTDTEYVQRLAAALAQTFHGTEEADARELGQWWSQPWVAHYRELLERADMPTVQRAMAAAGTPLLVAVVLTGELLGRERNSLQDLAPVVLADPAWAGWADYLNRGRNRERLDDQLKEL